MAWSNTFLKKRECSFNYGIGQIAYVRKKSLRTYILIHTIYDDLYRLILFSFRLVNLIFQTVHKIKMCTKYGTKELDCYKNCNLLYFCINLFIDFII